MAALIATTTVLGIVAYAVGVLIVPVAERRADAAVGLDVETRYPLGPDTPTTILARRAEIMASPGAEYTFSVDDPMARPPNWLLYLVHQPLAFTVFGIVNALLGLFAGWLTTGLSPPRRRNARWGLGLGSALVFYLLSQVGGDWVRASPDHSALLGAWLPVVGPLLVMVVLARVVPRRGQGELHGNAPLDV